MSRFFLYNCLLIAFSLSCTASKATDSTPDQTANPEDSAADNVYRSTISAAQSIQVQYDRNNTSGNPLQGFVTNYEWGAPNNDFPLSMEFNYIALSEVIQGPNDYHFDASLEPRLEASNERGHHLIPRFYLDYPNLPYGLPAYLQESVSCSPYTEYGGGCSPDYSNPELQQAILAFIAAFGERYDGDPRISFVQIGILGFWGEWHTYPHTEWFADNVFQQEVISAFDQAFDRTPLQLRYPIQDSPQRDIGFHDDSFAYATIGDVGWFFWPRIEQANAETQWLKGPMGGEVYPDLQSSLFSEEYIVGEYSQDFMEAVNTTHMTYILNYQVFNKEGTGYTGLQRANAEQAALAMGYEYTVEQIQMEAANLNDGQVDLSITVHLRNSGIAPFYYPLELQLHSDDAYRTIESQVENLLPDSTATAYSITLNGLSIDELGTGFELRLHSDWLLSAQNIYFANDTQRQPIQIMPSFNCSYQGDVIALGQSIVSASKNCFCDVDGHFYTLSGTACVVN